MPWAQAIQAKVCTITSTADSSRIAHRSRAMSFSMHLVGVLQLPGVTFRDRLRWWTWGRWQRRKAILAARDRFQQDILDIKKRPPK